MQETTFYIDSLLYFRTGRIFSRMAAREGARAIGGGVASTLKRRVRLNVLFAPHVAKCLFSTLFMFLQKSKVFAPKNLMYYLKDIKYPLCYSVRPNAPVPLSSSETYGLPDERIGECCNYFRDFYNHSSFPLKDVFNNKGLLQ